MSEKNSHSRWRLVVTTLVIAVGWAFWHANYGPGHKTVPKDSKFDKTAYSINDAASLWVVVNKGRVLPENYIPAPLVTPKVPLRLPSDFPEMSLRKDAASALADMFGAANRQSIKLMLGSGYRSYDEQAQVYADNQGSGDSSHVENVSARPGHSEHQTGLAADVEPLDRRCEFELCFGSTAEGKWLLANAYKFGFIVRYQKTTQSLTGYEYEPWHVRYVGVSLAEEIEATGDTLEQFFKLPAVADYPSTSFRLHAGS